LFIEPYELVVTKEMQNVLPMGQRDVKYEIGPFITLIDGPTFDFAWEERNKLLQKHILNSDRVYISRGDQIDDTEIDAIKNALATIYDKDNIYPLGKPRSKNFGDLIKYIV
jgi:G3E family GTPase